MNYLESGLFLTRLAEDWHYPSEITNLAIDSGTLGLCESMALLYHTEYHRIIQLVNAEIHDKCRHTGENSYGVLAKMKDRRILWILHRNTKAVWKMRVKPQDVVLLGR